jgi:tungstate transport system ATP-binding protein
MSLELVASDIAKKYDSGQVLQECSFSFRECGLYVLMGPNGSGKSTFLRICALLEEPDRGDVRFYRNGSQVEKDISIRRRITLLLPKIGVFNATVFWNAAYGLKIRGLQGDEIQERVGKALDFVGLGSKKYQKALTLSSGETQRLGIARALAIEPEIFFLDEPTASIDHKNTAIVEDILLKLKKAKKTIIIMTTHDMAQAERLADTMLIMQNGKLVTQSA